MKQLFLYGVFGGLTTVLNIFAYWALTRGLSMGVVPSTVIAWLIAVVFAYWSNRKYVFKSAAVSLREIITEAGEFFAARIATGVLDVIIMWLFVDVLGLNDVVIKTASNILVIILNYAFSKLLIFKGERKSKP